MVRIDAGEVSTRSALTPSHLHSASYFVQRARGIEERYDPTDKIYDDDPMKVNEHNAYCRSAIFCSVAFVEASINWVVSESSSKRHYSRFERLNMPDLVKAVNNTDPDSPFGRYASTLDKYQTFLELIGEPKFVAGEDPYQSVDDLRIYRNKLIHFSPEYVPIVGRGETEGEHGFEKRLQSRFDENDLNPFTGPGNPYFPNQCASYVVSKWGLASAIDFVEEFFDRIEIDPGYRHMLELLEEP